MRRNKPVAHSRQHSCSEQLLKDATLLSVTPDSSLLTLHTSPMNYLNRALKEKSSITKATSPLSGSRPTTATSESRSSLTYPISAFRLKFLSSDKRRLRDINFMPVVEI